MTTDAQTNPVRALAPRGDAPSELDPAIVAQYESLLAAVPDAEGEGAERILAQLAAAQTADDLDAPWRSFDFERLNGVELVVTGIRKSPSDFIGGLPWFLVIDAAFAATGETLTLVNGSTDVVAQLVIAYARDLFPLRVIPRVAARPTRNGFYPQHLEIVRDGRTGR